MCSAITGNSFLPDSVCVITVFRTACIFVLGACRCEIHTCMQKAPAYVHTQNYLKGQEAAKNSNGHTGKQHDSRCLGKPSQQQVSTLHQAVVALSA